MTRPACSHLPLQLVPPPKTSSQHRMARYSGAARRAALLLAAAALLAGLGGAAALDPDEQAVQQMLRGMLEVAEEINTGKEVESRVSAMAAPANLDSVNASDIQAKVLFCTASAGRGCRHAGSSRMLRLAAGRCQSTPR